MYIWEKKLPEAINTDYVFVGSEVKLHCPLKKKLAQ